MILLTRPEHLAAQTEQVLRKSGFSSFILPVLNIHFLTSGLIESRYEVLVITSQNAACAIRDCAWMKEKEIYAVGAATASLLQCFGFKKVIEGPGEAKVLASLLREKIQPTQYMLYLRGREVAHDLKGILKDAGFINMYEEVVYYTSSLRSLIPDEIMMIEQDVTYAMFYSAKTALAFKELALQHDLQLKNITALCISSNVASQIMELNWQGVRVASRPNEPKIMELLNDRVRQDKG